MLEFLDSYHFWIAKFWLFLHSKSLFFDLFIFSNDALSFKALKIKKSWTEYFLLKCTFSHSLPQCVQVFLVIISSGLCYKRYPWPSIDLFLLPYIVKFLPCRQFHQHYMRTFFVQIFCQSKNVTRNVIREKLPNRRSYKKIRT